MNTKTIRWLYHELPQWVADGILTPDAAERLRAQYGPLNPVRPARLAMIVLGIFGAVLIGAGIILVLAHNWEDLSRPVRTGLSFLPLVLAQGLAAWVRLKRSQSQAWCEGASALLFLMIGASISLVAQTYNISGDLPQFLLTWALLGLPLLYLFDALVPALFYLWGITVWAGYLRFEHGENAGYWALVLVMLPQLVRWVHAGRYHIRPTLLLWALCTSISIAAGMTLSPDLPGLWILLYTGLFALMFLAGECWFRDSDGFWSRPLRHVGAAGILILSLMLTYESPWHAIELHGYGRYGSYESILSCQSLPGITISSFMLLAAVTLLVMSLRRKTPLALLFGVAPILAVIGHGLASYSTEGLTAAALFNLYLLVAGLWMLISGLRGGKQGQMNVGLLAVAGLMIARFFDSDLSFLVRGLVFIALGVAFLLANLLLLRRKGIRHEQT